MPWHSIPDIFRQNPGEKYLLKILSNLRIPSTTKLCSESAQTTSFVLLDVHQLLTARIPDWMVSNVLCTAIDRRWRRGAVQVCAAVGEGDELGEGVGPLWSPQQRRVATLGLGE